MALLLLIVDFFFKLIPQRAYTPDQIENLKIIAHRGCHETGYVENTLNSFIWCVDNNIWGVEFDVRFTVDNIPVIHHDFHCGRLFNQPHLAINETKFSELRERVPEIPSLEEVIRTCGKKIHMMIEIKSGLNREQNKSLSLALSSQNPKTDYHILSLDTNYFKTITFINNDCFVPVAELNMSRMVEFAIQNKCAGLAGHYLMLTPSINRRLASLQINTGVGYVASRNSLLREIRRKHSWIFTDLPSSTNKWIAQLSK